MAGRLRSCGKDLAVLRRSEHEATVSVQDLMDAWGDPTLSTSQVSIWIVSAVAECFDSPKPPMTCARWKTRASWLAS